jgi:phenylpyruvate tautomerase PptA (4-oxalocrotonate tautomerase family)
VYTQNLFTFITRFDRLKQKQQPILASPKTAQISAMPLWRIYAHPDIFTPAQRAALARDITDLYVNKINLPAFYVNVFFIPLEQDNYYVGGEARRNFVRITAEHIARTMPSPDTQAGRDHRNGWMDMVNQVCSRFKPMLPGLANANQQPRS